MVCYLNVSLTFLALRILFIALRNRNFSIPTYNTAQYGKHSLRYLGPHIWSKLDKADKERPTLQSFETFIRRKNIADLIDNNCNSCTICSS